MRPRRRGKGKKLLVVLASSAVALVLAEGILRVILFAEPLRAAGFAWRLRNATLYTPREAGGEMWKLRTLLEAGHVPSRSPHYDPRFGWLKPGIDPTTLACSSEDLLAGRRPVLLFGDSYAVCVAPARVCWEDLLEESELSATHRLLNYGVGGYGLDQVHLLMEPVLERFRDRDPLVLIGILVDDDLDRCYLGLRGFPKPYFTLAGVDLVLHSAEHADAFAYLEEHPLRIRSYLWRWLLFGSGLIPRATALAWTDEADHLAVKRALTKRLLVEITGSLERRGLDHFFVLFHGRRALEEPELYGWQEPFLHEIFEELGIPFVSSRRSLLAHRARTGASLDDYYLPEGPGQNHYTELANRVVFEAFLAGLEGRFERPMEAGER